MFESTTLPLSQALSHIIDHRGLTPAKLGTTFIASGVPVASAMSVSRGVLDRDTFRFVDSETAARWMPVPLAPGDVLLTSEAPLGRVARVPTNQRIVLGQRLFGLRGRSGVLENAFLYYWLQTPGAQAQLAGRATGTTVLGIRQSALRDIRIDVPAVSLQRAIAEVLGALDDKIAANTRVGATSQALLRERFEALGIMAGGQDRLTDIVTLNPRSEGTFGSTPIHLSMQDLPTSDMAVSRWGTRPPNGGSRFMQGDTLLARITPCLENRKAGLVTFLAHGQIGAGSTEFVVLRSRPGIPTAVPYLIATHEDFRQFAIQHMVGTSGRQRVSPVDLSRFGLLLPPSEVWSNFATFSDPIVNLHASLASESRTLEELRDTLLPKLMSGELRVKGAEKQVEDVV